MKNLDETIAYYEKKAEECERDSHFDTDYVCYQMSEEERKELRECASEHRQLVELLRELKQRRKYENGCQYCKYKVRSDEDEPCIICSHNYTNKFKDDGTREVNADEDSD